MRNGVIIFEAGFFFFFWYLTNSVCKRVAGLEVLAGKALK